MPDTTDKRKNSSIHVRVDSRIREDAETILNSMGITISQFINMALYQVHIKRKIPFEIEANPSRSIRDNDSIPVLKRSKDETVDAHKEQNSKDSQSISNDINEYTSESAIQRSIWDIQSM